MSIQKPWYELLDCPNPLKSQYDEIPGLNEFEIIELNFGNDAIRVWGNLSRPPDKLREAESNAVARLGLTFWPVLEIAVSGYFAGLTGELNMDRDGDGILCITYIADDRAFSARCENGIIEMFDVYSEEHDERNKQTVLSYHNVWNSCLVALRSSGYELDVIGKPDPIGEWTNCSWQATRDNRILKAVNPIELMGLAGLNEIVPLDEQSDYWWVVEGPNLIDELHKKWKAKYFPPN